MVLMADDFRHHDRLRRRRGGFLGDIGELGAGGLREDRHGVGDVGAEIDAADVDGLQQRQAAGEFVPGDGNAERRQRLLELSVGLQDRRQRRGFLVADPELLGHRGLNGRHGKEAERSRGEGPQAEREMMHFGYPVQRNCLAVSTSVWGDWDGSLCRQTGPRGNFAVGRRRERTFSRALAIENGVVDAEKMLSQRIAWTSPIRPMSEEHNAARRSSTRHASVWRSSRQKSESSPAP